MADLDEQGGSSSTSVPKFATIDLADYNEFTKRTLKSTSETMVAFRKREGKQPCDLCVRNGEECIPVDPGRGIRCALCSKRRKVCSWRGDILIPATALHYGISAEDATQLYEKWVEVQSKPVDKSVEKPPDSNVDKDAEEPGPSTPVATITTKKPIFARKAFKIRRPGEFIFQLDSPSQSGNEAQPLTTSAPVPLTQDSSRHTGTRSGVLVNPRKFSLGDATSTSQSSNPAPPGKSATQPAKDSKITRKANTISPKIRVPRRSAAAAAAEASTRRGNEPPVSTVVSVDSENPKRARKLTLKAQATLENQGLAKKNPAGAKRKRDDPEGEPEADTSMAPRAPPRPRPRLSKTKGRIGRPPKRRKLQANMEPVKVTLKVRRVSTSKHHKSQPEETQTDVEMQDDPQPSSARPPILDGEGSKLSGDLEQRYSALEERYLKLCDVFAQGAIEAKAKDDRIKQLEEANQALEKKLKETTERLSQSEETNGA